MCKVISLKREKAELTYNTCIKAASGVQMCAKPKMQLRLLWEIQQELKATFYFTGAGNVLLTQQVFTG